jgi:drug/metabolite transporter (DMT)-like permease
VNQLLLLTILVAASLAQIPNIVATKFMPASPSFGEFLKVTLYISPIAIAACAAFMVYFQLGSGSKSYAVLSVLSVGVSVLLSVLIQLIFLPDSRLSIMEVSGSLIILVGVCLVLIKDTQLTN